MNLAKSLNESTRTPNFYLKRSLVNSLVLEPVTTSELYNVFKSLKNASPGFDEIKIENPQTSLGPYCNSIGSPL